MSDPQVIKFPKPRRTASGPKTDAQLSAEIHRAWRKYVRTVAAARKAGLNVDDVEKCGFRALRIWRDL